MRFLLVILLLIIIGNETMGQFHIWDTLHLEEVVVYGIPIEKYATGSRVTISDSLLRSVYQSSSVADYLSAQSPIFIKSYGAGMTSTISFRGTGAGHTSVLWNGININQPTLGQSDFSLFPMYAFDDIKLHHGSNGSLYGTDAIGGSVHLMTQPKWEEHKKLDFKQEIGSFGYYFTGVRFALAKKNWSSKTRVFVHRSKNDFDYENFTKPGSPVVKQENASYRQWGIIQDLYYRTASGSYIFLNGWYNNMDREIQPVMAGNIQEDKQMDESLRVTGGYNLHSAFGHLIMKGAYIEDFMQFNETTPINSKQVLGQVDFDKELSEKTDLKISGQLNRVRAEVENYGEDPAEEWRGDLNGSFRWAPLQGLEMSISARETMVSGFGSGLSPSLGLGYQYFTGQRTSIILKSQLSKGFRIPTLNERYWQPGGNPDLKPEESLNLEGTFGFDYGATGLIWNTAMTAYTMQVNNWIQWIPGMDWYWTPQNIKEVHAYGVEFSSSIKYELGDMHHRLAVNYAYSRSINKHKISENDRSEGKQLTYTPVHNASASWTVRNMTWFALLDYNYTGKRFVTSDNEDWLSPFYLVNLEAGKTFYLWKVEGTLSFRINNLFDESYQVMRLRAMPGRNYMMKFLLSF